jgi:hypothetical protein
MRKNSLLHENFFILNTTIQCTVLVVKGIEGKSGTPTYRHSNLICRGLLAGPKYDSAINCGERDLLVNQDMQAAAQEQVPLLQAQVLPATGTGTPCYRHRYSQL